MVTLSSLKVGDCILVATTKGPHPGVVIRVVDEECVVVCGGTGTPLHNEPEEVCFQRKRQVGLAMQLTKDTYFYARFVSVIVRDDDVVAKRPGHCPPGPILQLEPIYAAARIRYPSRFQAPGFALPADQPADRTHR